MTLEEKLEKFKSGTAAFYAPTRESYDRLMVILDKLGYIWANGRKPSDKSYDRWGEYRGNTCIYDKRGTLSFCNRRFYADFPYEILELTEEDSAAPSETVESVMKSIEELKADLESYHELFKKYGVVMTGNLEPAMRAKLESLLKKRVVS
jgi:hypothetical protein